MDSVCINKQRGIGYRRYQSLISDSSNIVATSNIQLGIVSASIIMSNANISQRALEAAASAKNIPWHILSSVWHATTNPDGYINVGVAENMLMHDDLLAYINTQLTLPARYLTYNDGASGSNHLRNALAAFLNKHLCPAQPLLPGHIAVTNGVSAAIEHMSWTLTDPGEGILLGRPYYGTFIADMTLRPGTKVIPVEFGACDPFSIDAVACYEQALLNFQSQTGRRVRALMLCHPHNPLGRCYPHSTLVALMRLCQRYQMHFISDEIYALSVWENTIDDLPSPPVPFESALSINTTDTEIIDPHLVHVLWGMSKDFGANGLRLGVIISQHNTDLQLALTGVALYSYTSSISDHLASRILEDDEFTDRYIRRNREKLSSAYAVAVRLLREYGIEYASGGNAAFFLWVNLGKKYRELHPDYNEDNDTDLGETVMQALLDKKVFVASGALFGSEKSGWFRIVFSIPQEVLEEALRRIMLALHA